MHSEQNDRQTPERQKHWGPKAIFSLSILIACWILWFVLDRGWIIAFGLSIVGCLCAEYLGTKLFTQNSWFDRLSVEHSGFSVWRIVLGVVVVLLFFSVIMLGRIAFLRIFH
jgi:hypothetical protein